MPDLTTIYQTLRQQGLEHITELSQQDWSDHNPSDPGITLLEQLCFALSDLEYRIQFDLVDLLNPGGSDAYSALHSPRQILTTQPVTEDDFRRLLIDTFGVKNARIKADTDANELWFAPFSGDLLLPGDRDPLLPDDVYRPVSLKGMWEVSVEAHRTIYGGQMEASLQDKVEQTLHTHRPLGIDYQRIALLDPQVVTVNSILEVAENIDPVELIVDVWEVLERYISPTLIFQGIDELQKQSDLDQIFDGPALNRGFLNTDDVVRFRRRTDLRKSDLIHEISLLGERIKAVRNLNFVLDNDRSYGDRWIVTLDPQRAPVFKIFGSMILMRRGDLAVSYDVNEARSRFEQRRMDKIRSAQNANQLDVPISTGRDRAVAHYSTLRDHLPALYGVGPQGLAPQSDMAQQSSARQLSAYLLFFEQLLANSFAQLASAWKLLSVNRLDRQSYFAQTLEDLPAIKGIYQNSSAENRLTFIENASEDSDLAYSRSDRFLDHLMARFSETMGDYGLVLEDEPSGEETSAFLEDKRLFLKEYPRLSGSRGTAFDYRGTSWDTENVAGLKMRIARLLGVRDLSRSLLANQKEGFYLLEHILLRPRPGDRFQQHALLGNLQESDPFSLQVSFVFPREAGRYRDLHGGEWTQFCDYVNRMLRAETPAHLQISVFWLNRSEIETFGLAYRIFLEALAQNTSQPLNPNDHQFALRIARDRLIDVLAKTQNSPSILGAPYPIRDLPLPVVVDAVAVDDPPVHWQAVIPIAFPQEGVTYVLADRNKRPVEPRMAKSGRVPDGVNQLGQPYIELPTPNNLTEEKTYWIRAEKNIGPNMRYVYLQQKVRVMIGITPIEIEVLNPEIDYGENTSLRLTMTQAGVDYLLFVGNTQINAAAIIGDPDNPIDVDTIVPGGLLEDTTIYVRGSRDSFSTYKDVGSALVRVRANPNLALSIAPAQSSFGGSPQTLEVLSDQAGNVTQASVNYNLYVADVPDGFFVHQKAIQPPADQRIELAHDFGAARITKFPLSQWNGLSSQFTHRAVASVENDGDTLTFDMEGLALQEDSLLVVVASKPDQSQLVVLHNPADGMVHLSGSLVYPDTSLQPVQEPSPVPSGARATVQILDPQPGVKYFLRIDSVDQRGVYYHDVSETSVRRDGVGLSKVGTDVSVGPVSVPLMLQSDLPLTATIQAQVIAEKAQTGMQSVITTLDLVVT